MEHYNYPDHLKAAPYCTESAGYLEHHRQKACSLNGIRTFFVGSLGVVPEHRLRWDHVGLGEQVGVSPWILTVDT